MEEREKFVRYSWIVLEREWEREREKERKRKRDIMSVVLWYEKNFFLDKINT